MPTETNTDNVRERLWSKIDTLDGNATDEDCWLWTGGKTPDGYGVFKYGPQQLAHRALWIVYKHDLTKRQHLCHKCDNPSCVNPSHLFVGTPLDNHNDKVSKGRAYYPKGNSGLDNSYSRMTKEMLVKAVRLKAEGKSYREVAAEIGVNYQTVHNHLSGRFTYLNND